MAGGLSLIRQDRDLFHWYSKFLSRGSGHRPNAFAPVWIFARRLLFPQSVIPTAAESLLRWREGHGYPLSAFFVGETNPTRI